MKKFFLIVWYLVKKLIIIAAIGYGIFLVSRTVWQNYIINQRISNLKSEIEEIKLDNNHLKNLIVYYGSNSYREIEARRKLGLKKPGETIVPLPEITNENKEEGGDVKDDNQESQKINEPNYIKWWKLIFSTYPHLSINRHPIYPKDRKGK